MDEFFLVYESPDGADLLSAEHMNALCKLHKSYVLDFPDYGVYFVNYYWPHHLPNYIACLLYTSPSPRDS